MNFLRVRKGLTQPLSGYRLIVTGSDVQVVTSPERLMSALLSPGQTSLAFVFDLARTVDEMKQEIDARKLKRRARSAAPQLGRKRILRAAL